MWKVKWEDLETAVARAAIMTRETTDGYQARDEAVVSRNMAAIGSKNSRAEMLLRRNLHGRGLRYRLHYKRLPGSPDIVFTRIKLAVFVDGDYWHGRVLRESGIDGVYARVKKNSEFWLAKFQRNVARDEANEQQLVAQGWQVIRIWESDILRDVDFCAETVIAAIARCSGA